MADYGDDFNRANGDIDVGNNDWVATLGTMLTIASNQVSAPSGENICTLENDDFDDDQEAEVTLTGASFSDNDHIGVGVRLNDSGGVDGYILSYWPESDSGNGTLWLDRYDNGVFAINIDSHNSTLNPGDKVKIIASGTTISAELDTGSGYSQVATGVDATHSSGVPGLYYDHQNVGTARLDDFRATGFNALDVFLLFGGGQSNFGLLGAQTVGNYSTAYGESGNQFNLRLPYDGAQGSGATGTAYVWNTNGGTGNAPTSTRWDYVNPLVDSGSSTLDVGTEQILSAWAINDYADDSVFFVHYHSFGSDLYSDWNIENWSTSLGDILVDNMVLAFTDLQENGHPVTGQSVNIHLAAFDWLQGESDAESGIGATAYGLNLLNLVTRIKEKLGYADTDDAFPLMLVKPPYIQGAAPLSGHNGLSYKVNQGYDFAALEWADKQNNVVSLSSAEGAALPDAVHMDESSAETVWEDQWAEFRVVNGETSYIIWDDNGATRRGSFVDNGDLDPFVNLTTEIKNSDNVVKEEFESSEMPIVVGCDGSSSTIWISSKDTATTTGTVSTFQPTLADAHTIIAYDNNNGGNYANYYPYGYSYAQVNLPRPISTQTDYLGAKPQHHMRGKVASRPAVPERSSVVDFGQFIQLSATAKNGAHDGASNSGTLIDSSQNWPTVDESGTHDGADDVTVLVDSSQSWTVDELVGATITNVTDGSSGTVTANTATTVTGVLLGGTDNDWDIGDSYTIEDNLIGYELFNVTDDSSGTITANTATTVTATLVGGDNDWDLNDVFRIENNNTVTRSTTGDYCLLCDQGISLSPVQGMRILDGGLDDPIDETSDFIRIAKYTPASTQNLQGCIVGNRQNFGDNTGSFLGQGPIAGAGFSIDASDNSSAMWRSSGAFNEARLNTLIPTMGDFSEVVVSAMVRIQDGGNTKYYNYNYNSSGGSFVEEVTSNGVVSSNSASIGEPPGAGSAGLSGSVYEVIERNIDPAVNSSLYDGAAPDDTNIINMLAEIYDTDIPAAAARGVTSFPVSSSLTGKTGLTGNGGGLAG